MKPGYCEGSTLKVTFDNQACGLAAPGRQRRLTFGFGRLKKIAVLGRALLSLGSVL